MAFVIADRVRETTTTTGTGSVTLAGAYTSFQSFSAAIGNGNSTYYTISNPTTNEWEVGIGTYTSGTNSLSRTTVLASSNAGSLVSFSAGTKDVFVTQPAERSLLVQSAGSGLFAGNAAFTANGLLYANATTTVTTGSALVFDGTNLGLGVTPSAWSGLKAFEIAGVGSSLASASNNNLFLSANAWYNGTNWRYGTSAEATQYQSFSGAHKWFTAPSGTAGNAISFTQAMTLDASGNLGVGTTSPTAYTNFKTLEIGAGGGTKGGLLRISGASNTVIGYFYADSLAPLLTLGSDTATPLSFVTGGTERARIDSSGNLGLGVTPSAWSVYKAYQVGRGSLINASTETDLVHNAFWNGTNWIYIANDFASRHLQINGQHRFFTASSGTAGNVITFTQAMTLDAIGMGVGTTTPLAKLDVNGTSLLRNTQYTYQPTPTSLTGTQTLTAAQLLTGILINTAGTGNWTMPTGTAIETGVFASLPVDSAIRFVVISTGGGGPTIATNTGVTLVGVMNVATASSATFILRKTATNTYTLYRA